MEGEKETLLDRFRVKDLNLGIGVFNSFSKAKNGKTLTVNPKLLEKMQNNPEKKNFLKR